MTEDEIEVKVLLENARKEADLHIKFLRLLNNPDYKAVFDEYMFKEMVSQRVSALADRTLSVEIKRDIEADIHSLAAIQEMLRFLHRQGAKAKEQIDEYENAMLQGEFNVKEDN